MATISWYRAGEKELYTLLVMMIASTLSISISYGVFTGIIWLIRGFLKKLKVEKNELREDFPLKNHKVSEKWVERLINKLNRHRYLVLFALNLVPYMPYLTAATVITAKLMKIPYGLPVILAGNALKVYFLTTIIYMIGNGL